MAQVLYKAIEQIQTALRNQTCDNIYATEDKPVEQETHVGTYIHRLTWAHAKQMNDKYVEGTKRRIKRGRHMNRK